MAIRANASLKSLAIIAVKRANRALRLVNKAYDEWREAKEQHLGATRVRDSRGRDPWQSFNDWETKVSIASKLWRSQVGMAWHLARHMKIEGPKAMFSEGLWKPRNAA